MRNPIDSRKFQAGLLLAGLVLLVVLVIVVARLA